MADIVTSRVFVDGEKGITAAKLNDITASSVIQPAFYTSKPTAGTADPTDIALILKSGAYAQVPVSTLGGSATQAQIWSTRLRSYNAIGNPNFGVIQRNFAGLLTNPVSGTFIEDRWQRNGAGTYTFTAQFLGATTPDVAVPGTSFRITNRFLRTTLTAVQASLGVSDHLTYYQSVEGPNLIELQTDVHSVSLLVRSSVANLNFGLSLRDPPTSTRSLTKLCTIPTANVWTLIQLPNLPVWPSGNFTTGPGGLGYVLGICLAAGTSLTSPANDTWQNGSFLGAIGQSNFAASPLNSTFDIAFVQHEPGAICTTLMDKPFLQNLDECLRYYQKSYQYGNAAGSATFFGGCCGQVATNNLTLITPGASFKKIMAKAPTGTVYSESGAVNNVRNATSAVDAAVSGTQYFYDSGIMQVALAASGVAGNVYRYQYIADTGW